MNLLGEAFALDSYSNFKFQRSLESTFLAFLRPTWSVHSTTNSKLTSDSHTDASFLYTFSDIIYATEQKLFGIQNTWLIHQVPTYNGVAPSQN
jgi:hypothetical protein